MIKTVAFDLGGVLFAEGKTVAMRKLNDEHGYHPQIVSDIISSPQSENMRRGLLSDDDFWQWVAGCIPKDYDYRIIKSAWYDGYTPNEDMFRLVRSLRGRYRLVIYSDNIKSRVAYLNNKYPFRYLFDTEVYSFDYHLIKTDVGFVDALIDASKAKPNEIAYIDDKEKVVNEARTRGLNVLIYKLGNIKELIGTLKNLGVSI